MKSRRRNCLARNVSGAVPLVLGVLLLLPGGHLAQSAPPMPEQAPSIFQYPEIQVEPSPHEFSKLDLPPGEALMDFAVSPAGPEVAILTRPATGRSHVLLWRIGAGEAPSIWQSDGGFAPRAMAWHPAARALFLLGPSGAESLIVRLDATPAGWKAATIFHSKRPLRRLPKEARPAWVTSFISNENLSCPAKDPY